MEKYGICEVSYGSDERSDRFIKKVGFVQAVKGLWDNEIWNTKVDYAEVKDIIPKVKDVEKFLFITLFKENDEWREGAKVVVKVIEDGEEEYITTQPNNIKKDNLESLPLINEIISFFEKIKIQM